jgi:hypothetical protein
VVARAETEFPEDWLLHLEILEILHSIPEYVAISHSIREYLDKKVVENPRLEKLIKNGVKLLA